MKTLVLYKSISGFTKTYAEWISEKLGADCKKIDEIRKLPLQHYDTVIFGGSLHAAGINGYKQFRKYVPSIGPGKIVIFAVGASPAKEGITDEIKAANLTTHAERSIPIFYLRGGFDYSKLNTSNKILMKLLKWKLQLKKERSPDEKGMLAAYDKAVDATDPEAVLPLFRYVQELQTSER